MCGCFCIGFIDFILKDKSLTNFTNFFSPNNLRKNDIHFQTILKMYKDNSTEANNIYPNFNDQRQFRLNKANKVK